MDRAIFALNEYANSSAACDTWRLSSVESAYRVNEFVHVLFEATAGTAKSRVGFEVTFNRRVEEVEVSIDSVMRIAPVLKTCPGRPTALRVEFCVCGER